MLAVTAVDENEVGYNMCDLRRSLDRKIYDFVHLILVRKMTCLRMYNKRLRRVTRLSYIFQTGEIWQLVSHNSLRSGLMCMRSRQAFQ